MIRLGKRTATQRLHQLSLVMGLPCARNPGHAVQRADRERRLGLTVHTAYERRTVACLLVSKTLAKHGS